ncbi:MAG TPA: DUF47 domain-containing protein [Elusimicrobia bacterium]|nr:DUF47 domain-containing protein [Elusimicrobiota bacterium]
MAFSLIPKEMKFFDLFDQQATNAVETAALFKKLVQSGNFDEEGVQKIRDLEHEGDTVTHEIIDTLNRTFVTPFDREDIHALACELDDITDMIQAISTRMKLYKLTEPNHELMQFAEIIEQSARAVAKAVGGLREIKRPRRILDYCIEVNRLENVGDQLRESAITKLFDEVKDPLLVIKWKEVYEVAETTLDKCEDVANIVEGILVKQG